MQNNLEQFHYDDLMADLASAIEQRGARAVVLDFYSRYPTHCKELQTQINSQERQKKLPALFKSNV